MGKTGEKKVQVVGAGFTGLVSAYSLSKAGFQVEVIEASDRVGGLIDTVDTDFGRIELAANGILLSERVETLFQETQVPMIEAGKSGKKRYFFRDGRSVRWPLKPFETLSLVARIPGLKKDPPREGETIEAWALRTIGGTAYRYLLAPALQGIYAGDPRELSAELILLRFFRPKKRKARKPTLVAPAGGMRALMQGLHRMLEERGVRFRFRETAELGDLSRPCVISTSLPAARKLLGESHPASRRLGEVRMLPLVCVHLAYPRELPRLEGFGCLFPRGEGVRSLGVLFEENVFGDRSVDHLERWILGGATDEEAAGLSNEDLFEIVRQDRKKWLGSDFEAEGVQVTRTIPALPHYDLRLRDVLRSKEVQELPAQGIFLMGNYAGSLGLSGIFEEAEKLPDRLRKVTA